MKIVLTILQKVLVNHFYRVNAGLFIFLFFVLFGLPQHPFSFHRALIIGIMDSQQFLWLVFSLWFLYTLKCIDYVAKRLNDQRQQFLFCLNNLSFSNRFSLLLFVQVLVYLPVLLYATAIIIVAISRGLWFSVVEVIVVNSALISGSAFIYVKSLGKETFVPAFKLPSLPVGFRKPLFIISLLHIWHNRKQMLFLTKLFSLLVLWLFLQTYEVARYDVRPLQLCLLLCMGGHSAVVFQMREFENEYLTFIKNLPIHSLIRFVQIVLMFAVLLLPELLFLWKGYGIHFLWSDYPQLLLTSIGLLCLFYSTLLLEETNMEQFMRIVFWIMVVCFFVLLYNPGVLFAFAVLLLSYAVYASYIYHFESRH